MKCFAENGNKVCVVSRLEKNEQKNETLLSDGNISLLRCRTGNLFGVGIIEKGISQMLLPFQYQKAIKKYFSKILEEESK